ncbi:MAG: T9SS type A sorting domain-containing protein [Bacteroidales bacterium]|nr:T9SS type A sorting domain-containing protein [Bacteroidales bacterium]
MTSNIGCATGNPATSNSITMTVNPNLPVSVSISVSENPICSGSSTTFTATPVNGGTTPGFQWQVNGSNVGSNSATYSSSSLVNNDVVSCILTSNATCATGNPATSNSITMTVNPNLPVSVSIAASSNPICSGTSVTFTATPTNGGTTPVYQWKLNGVNVGTNNPVYSSSILADADVVTCVLTSDATCATGNPATSNSITMTVNPNLPVSVSIAVSANPICSGSSSTFTATPANGGASPTYQWKVNGTNAGTNSASFVTSGLSNNDVVSCILTSNATCATGSPATSNTITMTVNPNLPVSVLISSDPGNILCSGGSVTFTAAPTNGGSSPGYQWKKNGVNVGANSTSYTDATLVNADAITCILTSNLTCTSGNPATSNSIGVTVNQTPTVPTSILSSPTAIYSDHSTPITLTASGGGGSGAVLTWYTNACGSGSPVGTGSPLSVDPPSVTTTYYARWENGTCYSNCISTSITVYANYRSKANGDWDKAATWEIYRAGTWVAAAAAPTSLDGTITICSPYTVTVTATAGYFNVDEVTIDAGGKLTINVCPSNWWFNIMNGPGTDITINGIMEYQDDKVSMASGATMLVGNGGKFQHNLNYSGNYPITVPTATWDQNSTYEVLSSNQLNIAAGMNQSFGHFTWNSTGQTSDINLNGGLTTVNGNFSVLSTGTKVLYLTNTSALTLNIGKDLIIQGGILDFSLGAAGTKVVNLSGNYLQTGGIFRNTNSGVLTFNFKGAGKTFTQSGGTLTSTYFNWDVASTASLTLNNHLPVSSGRSFTLNGTLDCGLNAITGAGTYTMNNAAKLIMASPAGITNVPGQGNIQSTVSTFGTNCDFEFNGVTAQSTGNRLPSIIRNLIIGNTNGVSLTNSTLLNGQLALQSGEFILGNMSFTLQNTDIPILKTEGTISTSPGSNLSFGSPGNISGNAFVIPDNIFSTNPSLNNFSIHRANSLTLNNQEMSVYGTVLSNGPLNTNNNLTLKSTASQTALIDGSGSGNITGTVTVERYIPSGFGYKYISSPFQTMTVGALSEYVDLSADFPNFYRYEEDRPASGWINYTNPSGVLLPMTGYAINLGESMTPLTLEATGNVNNNLNSSLSLYNHNQTYTLGFNLVGNPYPSPVDWNSSNGWTRTNIDNAIYYFNAGVTDQYSGTYSSYVNGISSDGYADNVIPAMQGFFIHVTDGSYPVQAVFGQDNRVRVNNLTPDFHKGLMQNFKPLVRLSASYSTNPDESDYLAVYFEQGATSGFDAEYDALKLLNTDKEVPNIFTLNTSGEKLSINAHSSIIDSICIIPVGVKSAKSDWLDFKPELVEMLPPGMKVFLADEITGEIQQVDEQFAYHAFVSEGESVDRFSLIFSYKDISHIPPVNDQLNAYYSDHKLKVYMDLSLGSKANLIVSTMLGQQVFNQSLNGSGTHELDLEVPTGIYLISLQTSKGIISRKIFISNL